MIRTHTCPYCGSFLKMGHGAPQKDISSPVNFCSSCRKAYIDNNAYEWAVLDWIYKLYFYFFANNRWIPYFLSLIPMLGGYWAIPLVVILFWSIGCFATVNILIADDVELSHKRCLQPGYVDILIKSYDKVSMKKCEEYKRESARLQSIGQTPEVKLARENVSVNECGGATCNNNDTDGEQTGEKCELCNRRYPQLTYCVIKDDMGTRYRNICDDCIQKYNAKPTARK